MIVGKKSAIIGFIWLALFCMFLTAGFFCLNAGFYVFGAIEIVVTLYIFIKGYNALEKDVKVFDWLFKAK